MNLFILTRGWQTSILINAKLAPNAIPNFDTGRLAAAKKSDDTNNGDPSNLGENFKIVNTNNASGKNIKDNSERITRSVVQSEMVGLFDNPARSAKIQSQKLITTITGESYPCAGSVFSITEKNTVIP